MNTVDIVTSHFENNSEINNMVYEITICRIKKSPSTTEEVCVHTGRHISQNCSDDVTHILNRSSTIL